MLFNDLVILYVLHSMTAVATNELNSKTAINTAQCFKKIDNIFDCLNSRSLKVSNPNRQGLSIYNKLPYTTVVDALEYFKKIEVFEGEYDKKNIYFIEGFQWTIKAVLIQWDNLQKGGVKYFLTSCLNQDPLENLFSVIRNRGGYNSQPTARELRIALQHNMHIRLQNSDSSRQAAQEYFSSALESDNEEGPFTLESCCVAYIAAYLDKFLMDKVNCPCTAENVSLDAMDLSHTGTLIFHRDFGNEDDILHLKKPTDIFFSVRKNISYQEFTAVALQNFNQTAYYVRDFPDLALGDCHFD
nr:unnamed protein product [Callosobruchus analis]